MPLLADYAITPDVFDVTSYSNEEVCRLYLQKIGSVLRTQGGGTRPARRELARPLRW